MKFTLTFDGELPPSGNNHRPRDKWTIRNRFSPQLEDLWATHPSLSEVLLYRWIPKEQEYHWSESHHQAKSQESVRPVDPNRDFDLCADISAEGYNFRPIVRDSLGLVCSLNILFMRKEPIGRIYQGGDLDNRIKTLLDALRVPSADEIRATKLGSATGGTIFCLLEDDRLISGLNVESRRLLNRSQSSAFTVHLVIEVDVRITHSRAYNRPFLTD